MKQYLLFIIIVLPALSFSQPTGFGIFKLGALFSDIKSKFPSEIKTVNEDKIINRKLERDKNVVDYPENDVQLLYKIDSYLLSHDKISYIIFKDTSFNKGDYVLYFVPSYNLAKVQIEDIYLLFKNNILVAIESMYSQEIAEALKEKYKPTYEKNKIDTVLCRYNYTGAENKKDEIDHEAVWDNDTSFVTYVLSDKYNDKCESVITAYLRFFDKTFYLTYASNFKKQSELNIETQHSNQKKLLDSL